jgi:hypothetical protein
MLQEIELFMNEADKHNRAFFPKLVPMCFRLRVLLCDVTFHGLLTHF